MHGKGSRRWFMKMFVANLSREVSLEDVRSIFGAFGRVINVVLATREQPDTSTRIVFLEMPVRTEGAVAILTLDGSVLKGRAIVVSELQNSPAV
jgi:RNA recognition motif-containing protein